MGFPHTTKLERNDLFGPSEYNNRQQRQDFLYDFLGVEHDPATGEHNTPHVARTLGHVVWSGSAYSLSGFNSDVSLATGHNPTAGTVILTLAADRYDHQRSVIEVQPADASGSTNAWVGDCEWLDATHLVVYLKKNGGALSSQQAFAAADGDFFIGIRSPRIPNSAARYSALVRRSRDQGLRVDASNYNPFIQQMGDNRAAALAGHTSAGLHDTREVAKAVGRIVWDGTDYRVRAHRGLGAGVQRIATGQARVFLTDAAPAVVAPVQAFVSPVSAAVGTPSSEPPQSGGTGSSPTSQTPQGLRLAMVPKGTCLPGSVDVFLFESYVDIDLGSFPAVYTYRWRAVDGDFGIRVHGA